MKYEIIKRFNNNTGEYDYVLLSRWWIFGTVKSSCKYITMARRWAEHYGIEVPK